MIARPKISQNEWKTAEKGAFEVGNFALLSCPDLRRDEAEAHVVAGAAQVGGEGPRPVVRHGREVEERGEEARRVHETVDDLCANQIFNPTSMCAYANVLTQALQLGFENSTRAIDPSKNQPNRLRFDLFLIHI